jgi:hypothetical protein
VLPESLSEYWGMTCYDMFQPLRGDWGANSIDLSSGFW